MNINLIDIFSLLSCIKDEDISAINDITSANFQQDEIYLGTAKGTIYKLENQILDEDENSFVTSLLDSLDLIPNCPIQQICICAFLDLLVVLINDSLSFVNLNPLEIRSLNIRLKNVTAVSVTEGVSSKTDCVTKMCVSLSNKRLNIYLVEVDRLTILKEVTLPSVAIVHCINLDVCCFASSQAYMIVNLANDRITELFRFDSSKSSPKIASLPDVGEFILRGPGGLGVFADVEGASQKPPIQWSSMVRDFVVLKSLIVAIDNEFVTVHSISNQSQVQTIHLPNQDSILVNSRNGVMIIRNPRSSNIDILQMVPLSWNQQALQYLNRNSTDTAVSIATKQLTRPNVDFTCKQKCQRVFTVAGFQKFRDKNLKEAKLLFERGQVDLRELIFCYDGLLPKSYKFEPKIATLASGFHLTSLFGNLDADLCQIQQYKQFLLEFLVEHRESKLVTNISQIVETALVKLYVELEPEKLFHNFTMMLTDFDYDDLVDYLTTQGHYHACAMVMQWYGQIECAIDIWSRLARKEISDPHFPGTEFLKEVLSNVSDPKIIAKNIDWLLVLDWKTASNILIQFIDGLKNEKDLISCLITDTFMKHLENYPDALFDVLFALCQNNLLESHQQSDYLGQIFMKRLSQNMNDKDKFESTREQFFEFLSISDDYPAKKLLKQVREFSVPLQKEEALLLGQMSEHQAALAIIVNQLHDFQLADRYCFIFEKKFPAENLFLSLLKVYLKNGNSSETNEYTEAALRLLESHTSFFDLTEVLAILPSRWPLNRLREFLLKSFVLRQQTCFTTKMKYGLEKAINSRKAIETRATIQNNKLVLEDWKQLQCSHCGIGIDDCSFIKTRTGQILHKHCFNCV